MNDCKANTLGALIAGFISELEAMKNAATLRGNDLMRSDELRASYPQQQALMTIAKSGLG